MLRRPPKTEWLGHVRWRTWFRLPAIASCILATLGGLAFAIVGLVQVIRSDASTDASTLIPTGILLAALGPVVWAVVLSGELIISRPGLFLGFTFIPWREIAEIREDPLYLSVRTPSVRAYWNGWSGTVRIPKLLFDVPGGFGDRLNVWAHQGAIVH